MRMRAGHRSSVTRNIGQIDEAIETLDARNLRQFQQSLFKKSDILAQLDEELLNEVETEQLEYEIEQADIVMEKLNLALSAIKEALETISTEGKEGVQHNRKPQTHQSTPESEDDDHSPSPPAVTSDLTATTSANQTCKFTSLIPTGSRTKHRVSFPTLGDDGSLQTVSQLTDHTLKVLLLLFALEGFLHLHWATLSLVTLANVFV